jgi:hypothetical protein
VVKLPRAELRSVDFRKANVLDLTCTARGSFTTLPLEIGCELGSGESWSQSDLPCLWISRMMCRRTRPHFLVE